MKRSSPSPTSASGSNSNNNDPIASTPGSSKLSVPDLLSLKLSEGTISQAELAKVAQMVSHLHEHPVPPSARPRRTIRAAATISSNINGRRKDKGKRTLACIELGSDGEEVVELLSLKKVCFTYSCLSPPTDFPF